MSQEARLRKPRKEDSLSGSRQYEDYFEKEKDTHSCTWTILKIIFLVIFSTFLIILVLPSPIEPIAHRFPPIPQLKGPLAPNEILSKGQHLYENQLVGPEHILIEGDHLYTGTADGKILDIYKGEIRVVTRLGKEPCGRFEDEATCGRPLGMAMDKDGYLVVCDAYLGIFKVNVATGDSYVLWPSSAPIDGKHVKLFNNLAITDTGMIYFTDSSTKWERRNYRLSIMEMDNTGRLIAYDPKLNTTTVVMKGLSFPNGLVLSRDEEFLLMSETTKYRIWKYYLKGNKQGKAEVAADNLPGFPDNLGRSSTGGFWVGLALVRWTSDSQSFSIFDSLAPYPLVKKFISKIVPDALFHLVGAKYGLVVEIDRNGKILRSLHDPTGLRISSASHVVEKDGALYIGSFIKPYIAKVYLKQ